MMDDDSGGDSKDDMMMHDDHHQPPPPPNRPTSSSAVSSPRSAHQNHLPLSRSSPTPPPSSSPPPTSSSSSSSTLDARVNAFRAACLDVLIGHQTHHLIPHSSKVIIFDSKLKVQHAFDGLVTHDINCFAEADTRVMTDRGMMWLHEIEERLAKGERVRYACFEKDRGGDGGKQGQGGEMGGRLLYCDGDLVIPAGPPPAQLLEFSSSSGGKRRWGAGDSSAELGTVRDDDGHEELIDDDGLASGVTVSLRVTPEHDMFVQLGRRTANSRSVQWATRGARSAAEPISQPPSSIRASQLQSSHDSDEAMMRFLCCADAGRTPTADELAALRERVQRRLGLSDAQLDAFLELFGLWLVVGSLEYSARGPAGERHRVQAVCCAQAHQEGVDFLNRIVPRLGLSSDAFHIHTFSLQRAQQHASKLTTVLYITEPRWFAFFDDEFGAVHPQSQSSTPTSDSTHRVSSQSVPQRLSHSSITRPYSPSSSSPRSSSSSSPSFSYFTSSLDEPDHDWAHNEYQSLRSDGDVDEERGGEKINPDLAALCDDEELPADPDVPRWVIQSAKRSAPAPPNAPTATMHTYRAASHSHPPPVSSQLTALGSVASDTYSAAAGTARSVARELFIVAGAAAKHLHILHPPP